MWQSSSDCLNQWSGGCGSDIESYTLCNGSRRKWKTMPAEDLFIRLQALPNRRSMARDPWGELINAHGTVLSTQTVHNRLRVRQLKSWRPLRMPRLQPNHWIRYVQFAQEHVQWQLRHWTPVFFSDESRFHLSGLDGRIKVWRRERECTLPCSVQKAVITEADHWWCGEEYL